MLDESTVDQRARLSRRLLSIYQAGLPFPETAAEVLAALVEGEAWRAAALWVPDVHERAMVGAATWISDPRFARFSDTTRGGALPVEKSAIGRAWQQGTTTWIDDLGLDDTFLRKDLLLECGLPTVFLVPVEHEGRVLGVLEFLGSIPAGDRLRPLDVSREVLDGLAGLLHTHIAGEQARRQQDRLELALQASGMGTWEWDRRTGHVIWSTTLEEMYGFEPGGFPGTYEAYQERVHPDDRAALSEQLRDTVEHPKDHHVLHRIVLPNGTVRWIEGHARPLLDGDGRLFGLTGVSTDVTEREQLLAGLAKQVELTQDALADRVKIADTLQRSLRPDRLPHVDGLDLATGFRPGTELVGGDFYDGFRQGDHWYFCLGDVCGHGPEAAAQTGLARHALRGLVAAGLSSPADILRELNAVLLTSPTHDFVSIVLARVTVSTPVEITLCRAGHPLPVVRPACGPPRLIELVDGDLLGLGPDVKLTEQAVTLRSGEALVLYTDGVTEARRPGELFGEERLLETVGAAPAEGAAIVDQLLRAVERFETLTATDDLAILTIVVR